MQSDPAISAVGVSRPVPVADASAKTANSTAPIPVISSPGSPNPTLRLDAALGLVVIEFLGKTGAVTSSIPTQQQLQAYRAGTEPIPGQHVDTAAKIAAVST